MASLQEDMAIYFTALSIIDGYAIDCFADYTPDEPDEVVVLYEYNGDRVNPFTDVGHRSIQILTRSKNQDIAKGTAYKLFNALRSANLMVRFTEERIGQVHIRQSPFKLKTDENNRIYYCFNIGITTTFD
jgi:hypothetical protein